MDDGSTPAHGPFTTDTTYSTCTPRERVHSTQNGITDEEQYTMENKNDLEFVYRVFYYTETEDKERQITTNYPEWINNVHCSSNS